MNCSIFRVMLGAWSAAAVCVTACAPSSLVDVAPSSTLVDPSTVTTASGATQLYNFALSTFAQRLGGTGNFSYGLNSYIVTTGLFTDELLRAQIGSTIAGMDERNGGALYGNFYNNLHQARVQTGQAREALHQYGDATSVPQQAEMYALEAYTLVYFAELFCSGIPLTRVPLSGPATPTRGFSTTELLERAGVMFDSAMTLSGDTGVVANLAKAGKGRALLALGKFADAANAVRAVPTDFMYQVRFDPAGGSTSVPGNELGTFVGPQTGGNRAQVIDREGTNGLVWSNDPRSALTTSPSQFGAMLFTVKYSKTSAGVLTAGAKIVDNPIRVADGLEARLIEAEAALAAGNASWLTILNTLRTTCVGTATCAPIPGLTAALLPPLSDPGSNGARLDLIMRERALWLFVTGHRQGDLRRLAKVYQRDPGALWPTGTYVNAGFAPNVAAATTHGTAYGSDVVYTPATNEQLGNPLYTGCFDLNP